MSSRSINPIWTADGKRIVYRSSRNRILNLFARLADGSCSEERLTNSNNNETPTALSPDGQALVFQSTGVMSGYCHWLDKKPRPFLQTPFTERAATFSPDSRWLAYNSDESGRNEVYIQPVPGGGGEKVQISRDGGMEPRWISNDLFYRNGNKMMAG